MTGNPHETTTTPPPTPAELLAFLRRADRLVRPWPAHLERAAYGLAEALTASLGAVEELPEAWAAGLLGREDDDPTTDQLGVLHLVECAQDGAAAARRHLATLDGGVMEVIRLVSELPAAGAEGWPEPTAEVRTWCDARREAAERRRAHLLAEGEAQRLLLAAEQAASRPARAPNSPDRPDPRRVDIGAHLMAATMDAVRDADLTDAAVVARLTALARSLDCAEALATLAELDGGGPHA